MNNSASSNALVLKSMFDTLNPKTGLVGLLI